jgi:hypothetical protein
MRYKAIVLPNWAGFAGPQGHRLPKEDNPMSQHHYHAVIWIEKLVLHPDHPTKHIHHKANAIGSGHAETDDDFLHAVAASVADAGAVLITGPANTKAQLVAHIDKHDPALMKTIAGVETVDHPSDAELVAFARHYLAVSDRMTPQEV